MCGLNHPAQLLHAEYEKTVPCSNLIALIHDTWCSWLPRHLIYHSGAGVTPSTRSPNNICTVHNFVQESGRRQTASLTWRFHTPLFQGKVNALANFKPVFIYGSPVPLDAHESHNRLICFHTSHRNSSRAANSSTSNGIKHGIVQVSYYSFL